MTINEYLRRTVEPTWSGMEVSPQTALSVAAVFACTRVIAEDIGKLPFEVYQQTSEHERIRATNSPFWRLIHDRPNPYQTSQQFREYLTASALLRGNGFALKTVVDGQVRELMPLPPDSVTIELTPDWEMTYKVMVNGRQETLTRKEIFHLPGLTIDGPAGVSVIQYARQTLGIALGANRHAGTFFGNGMKPSGIFKHPKELKDKAFDRLKAQLAQDHGGPNQNKTLIIEEGMDYTPITMTNKDSQFLESRTFEVVEICRWFRVPPHKVAELSRATFSNIEHQAMEYVSDALMPWAKRWEYAINQQAIVTNRVFAELNFDALLRGSTLERYQAYQIAAGGNAPWMVRNEIRRRENLAPLPGLDEVLQPLNMTAADQEQQEASS